MKTWKEIAERLIWKVTSGRFIFTIIVGFVFAYLACTGALKEDRVMEVVLVVLYAYFTQKRQNGNNEHKVDTTKTTISPSKTPKK